VFETAGG